MIFIISAGRSGSGCLSVLMNSLGYPVVHERIKGEGWRPEFVVAETELVHCMDLADLQPNDKLIFLLRTQKDIQKAINRLLPGCDIQSSIDGLVRLLMESASLANDRMFIYYDELFEDQTAMRIADFLKLGSDEVLNKWQFLKHFKVTNQTCEQEVKEAWRENH